ncbi:carcinoembryonic antigen-related cell adhesion molecule 1-like isoform X2 [Pristis pectinata]|uniref:carcinoembryonic antigen-related cell adhesion molecule 1-like isoform X2 n=1 Tax=Pristis pectinata TaxID=685728 RepID=UPI00223E2C7C|nr:carcinoembryonic antigen-related cell adhesion molecule 1-like isoform X2 [Pristis pectinata]
MVGLPLTAVALCLFIPAGESQVFTVHAEHSRINVTVGGNALFSVRPSAEVTSGSWAFYGKLVLQWINANVVYGSGYQSRAELFSSNGSLLLRSVNMSDSGEYIVNMLTKSGSSASATITLRVLEPVSKPIMQSTATDVVEYRTVILTCIATGTEVSYLWLQDNIVIIPGGRFELGAGNSTFTIPRVLRTDGPFSCRADNLISGRTSDPFYLNVYYGPDCPHVTTDADSAIRFAGSTITSTCFAQSSPAADLDWYLNGSYLQTGQQLILETISVGDMGNYTCQAYNRMTGRYIASTVQIIVLEVVSDITVSTNDSTPVENVDAIALTCHALGTVQTRTWLKNNQRIKKTGRISTSPDNSELTITSVNRNDAGTYKCIVSNSFSSGAGETYVQVYSPLTDACCTLCPGAIAGIVLGLLGVGLISGMSGWLIGRKTGGVKGPPQAKYGKSITSGGKSTLATNTANTLQTYENFPRNEQNISTNAPDGNSTYMGLKLEDRSVYSDLRR